MIEQHPANWYPNGVILDRAAGFKRNVYMASLGARFAIGFRSPGKSNGTDHMRQQCALRGISGELIRSGTDWDLF